MEKKEVQELVRTKLQEAGFRSQKNSFYKIVDSDYMIGLCMSHSSYIKGYMFHFGGIYLVDEDKEARIKGAFSFDYRDDFRFTDPEKKDTIQDVLKKDSTESVLWWFQYDIRSKEEFIEQFEENLNKCLTRYSDKWYILNMFRAYWPGTIPVNMKIRYKEEKICHMLGKFGGEVSRFVKD